jgi:RNA 3'-terminal phosphate cyclase (ATP)
LIRICELLQYRASSAPVGEYHADQLLIPYSLAIVDGAPPSGFTAIVASPHARTNAEVIEKFLSVHITMREHADRVVFLVRSR